MFPMASLFSLLVIGAIIVLVVGMRRPGRGELPPGMVEELRRLRDAVEDLSERVGRVEDEREFDRRLLESIAKRELPPGDEEERA